MINNINIKNLIYKINSNSVSFFFLLVFLLFSGISISVSQAALGLAVLAYLAGILQKKSKYQLTGLEKYIIPFILISLILALISQNRIVNLLYIKDFWLLFALILASNLIHTVKRINIILYLILIIILLQSAIIFIQTGFNISFINDANRIGIFHYSSIDATKKIRGGFLGMHLVFTGYFIFLVFPALYILFSFSRVKIKKMKPVFAALSAAALMSIIAVFLVGTRSVIIALPFAAVPFFFLNRKSRIAGIVFLILLTAGAGGYLWKYGQDLKTGENGSILDSVSGEMRMKIWETAFRIWKKYPLTGTGGGNYHYEYQKALDEHPELNVGMISHAHNDYLNQFARKGAIGLLVYLFMLYGIFKYMTVNLKHIRDNLLKGLYLGIFGAFCVFLAASMFQCFYTDEINLAMLWFSVGLLAAIVNIEKGKNMKSKIHVPFHRPYITESEINAVSEALRSGWLTMGELTKKFEADFRKYIRTKEAIAVNSCTAALHLALKCTGIGKGDEIVLPAITHTSTAEVITYFNAKPVFADVERDTHLIDASKIAKKITKKTKAIVPVHYAGQPADMDEIIRIAKANNLHVIEDAAHTFPSKYKNKDIGAIGDATCFSFYPTKTMTTGEGGMITTNNGKWAEYMRAQRLHGVTRDAWDRAESDNFWEYDVEEPGFKYNITDIASALGIEQLKKTEMMQNERVRIAEKYNNAFKDIESILLYTIKENRQTSWCLYPLKLVPESLKINRDRLVHELKMRGISASVHFIPLYRFTYYKNLGYKIKDFPESEWIFERTFSLPIFPGMTGREIDYVIENVVDIIKKNIR